MADAPTHLLLVALTRKCDRYIFRCLDGQDLILRVLAACMATLKSPVSPSVFHDGLWAKHRQELLDLDLIESSRRNDELEAQMEPLFLALSV